MSRNEQFERFLTRVARYLYDQGWYTQSNYVQERTTYEAVAQYLEDHCYSREKSQQLVEQFKQEVTKTDMTDKEKLTIWDQGWKAYWDHKEQKDCPDYPDQEQRDEWMSGWLTAQSAEMSAAPTVNEGE